MAQDRFGYMWFADQNCCLVRYDGYRMKTYRHNPRDTNSVGSNGFECIAADPSGNIWIGVPQGLDKYDPATNKFIHYRYPSKKDGFGNVLLIDHSGIVWLGTNSGLERFDPVTQKVTHYVHSDNDTSSISSNVVRSLYEDKAGVLWVGTGLAFDTKTKEGGLNRFNKQTGKFTRYLHNPNNPQSLISNKVRAMFEDSKGNFWVGSDGDGLHIMDREAGTFKRFTHNSLNPEKISRPPVKKGNDWDHITFITEDVAGKIWIGTYAEGIICHDPITKKTDHFNSTDKNRAKGYTDNSSWAIYVSKEGVLWISNESNELFRVDPLQTGFSETKMDATVAHFFEEPPGNLWMTLEDKGLVIVNAETNAKKYFSHNPADSFSISSNKGTFIQPAQGGQYWVGSWNGLNRFDPQTGKFKRLFYTPETKNHEIPGVFALHETRDETYLGVFPGLRVMNKKTGGITHYVNNPTDTHSISAGGVINFLAKGDGNIWMSVYNNQGGALDLYNIKTKKFRHYLDGLMVWDIFKSSNGKMWVGTSKGLYYRNDSLDSFLPVGPEKSDFRASKVKSMTEDAEKNIWGVSSLGIFRFNPHSNELAIYGDKFGTFDVSALPHEPSFTASNGELFFGNPRGYYKCFSNNVINYFAPEILLTDFKLDGHSILPDKGFFKGPLEDATEITLKHNQNIFSIDFAAVHFSDPENNTHEFMLAGYENAWREVKGEKTAYYFNVPKGHYVFKIKATSSYGIMYEKSFEITILPPWWQTWWFKTLVGIFLAALLYAIYRWRTASLRSQKRKLERTVKERTAEVLEEKAVVERQKDVIEKEKEKSDELLLNILPTEVAEELKEKGYTTAKSFDEVTVLFSDIKGFTNVAEKMTAQELVKEINTYFSAFDHIILKYGLEKIKTIGDAYIAAGGLPEKNSATAQSVVEAAIAMQREVERLKQERIASNKPYFELRIGIHTGPVVAGVVGIKKFQYDIWGDTVNLAARMEQSGIPGKINISHHTYEAVKDQFTCIHRGKIEAKNKGEMDMYFVE